jgi:hypothetical protein
MLEKLSGKKRLFPRWQGQNKGSAAANVYNNPHRGKTP